MPSRLNTCSKYAQAQQLPFSLCPLNRQPQIRDTPQKKTPTRQPHGTRCSERPPRNFVAIPPPRRARGFACTRRMVWPWVARSHRSEAETVSSKRRLGSRRSSCSTSSRRKAEGEWALLFGALLPCLCFWQRRIRRKNHHLGGVEKKKHQRSQQEKGCGHMGLLVTGQLGRFCAGSAIGCVWICRAS